MEKREVQDEDNLEVEVESEDFGEEEDEVVEDSGLDVEEPIDIRFCKLTFSPKSTVRINRKIMIKKSRDTFSPKSFCLIFDILNMFSNFSYYFGNGNPYADSNYQNQ